MSRSLLALVMVLALTGCASRKGGVVSKGKEFSKEAQVSEHSSEVPAWVYAPLEGCDEEAEMCASGEGPGGSVADANAMKSLAAIFETRIVSTVQSDTFMSQEQALRSSRENASASVREEVAQTLEAASIKARHRHKGMSYSLASLDKEKAAAGLRTSMDRAQAELAGMWKRRDRTGWARMWELMLTRDALNDRLFLITGAKLAFDPSAQDLQGWYQARKAGRSLGWEGENLSSELEGALKSRLTEAGWVLAPLKDPRVRAVLEAKPTHIKVKGFERWEFSLTLEHLHNGSSKKGVVHAMTTTTGRSRADCESKARPVLLKHIETNLSQLNLED